MRSKLGRILTCVLIALFLASAFYIVNPVHAAGTVNIINVADGTSNFNFTAGQKNVGDTIVMNITIIGATDISTWQVGIQWDKNALGFVSMIRPSDHILFDKSPIATPPDTSTPGLVVMGVSAGPGQTGFTGNGRLAQLTLNITKVPGAGEIIETDINFEGITFDTFLLDSNLVDVSNDYTFNKAHYKYTGPAGPVLAHDVAVTNVAPSATSVLENSTVNINVTVANKGNFTETFSVGVTANGISVVVNQTATDLASGASITLTFAWNTTGSALGSYSIVGLAGPVASETNTADNTRSGGTVQIVVPGADHDVAVVSILPKNTVIGQGFTLDISVTVMNNGLFSETFNVTIFANATQAAPPQTVANLDAGKNVTLLFQWNTKNWTISNYTLSATADTVPGEPNTANNTLVNGNIYVMLPGDVNNDGIVNITDIATVVVSHAFNAFSGGTRYMPFMDIDGSGRIDTRDLLIIAINFMKHL